VSPPVAAPGPVSSTPVVGTPHFTPAGSSDPTEQIKQLVQCGSTMYAVGSFTQILSGSATPITRNNAFSFEASPPYTVTSWNPNLDGTVYTIGFNGNDCSHAYLGGSFTTVGGSAAKGIAEVDTKSGALTAGFASSVTGTVETMVGWHGRLLVGGTFTSINGSGADKYFASLSPTTGKDDGYLALAISGSYSYTDDGGVAVSSNETHIVNQQLSPDGTKDLIEGDFTTIGGQLRQQIAMIDLVAGHAKTDGWDATGFNAPCAAVEPTYVRTATWSPDEQTVYVATTGYKPANGPGYVTTQPRAGLCDSASAFPATPPTATGDVAPTWINYTGCDSLYSVAADANIVYVGGHERWADNPDGCDEAGSGAVAAPGMVGLNVSDGSIAANPTRARGLGADDMLLTPAGLWIASDNFDGSDTCGTLSDHAGLCLLPYTFTANVPTVVGTVAVGHQVSCSEAPSAGLTVTYQWRLSGAVVSTTSTYVVPVTAYGHALSCRVTVQAGSGPTRSASSAVHTVHRGRALVVRTRPTFGAPKVGHRVTVTHGQWSPSAKTFTYQWYVAGHKVKGATHHRFRVPKSAAGHTLVCQVTASTPGYAPGRVKTVAAKVKR
jgi:hypothetical protein